MYKFFNQRTPRLENGCILIFFIDLLNYQKVKLEKNDTSKSSLLFYWFRNARNAKEN